MRSILACVWVVAMALSPALEGTAAVSVSPRRAGQMAASNGRVAQAEQALNAHTLAVLGRMPRGGGYQTGALAFQRLCTDAVEWNERRGRLDVSPRSATPSFCSEAAYLALVLSLQEWEKCNRVRFSREFWRYMLPEYGQADGVRGWGRLNANGPGLAKWAYELGFGVNFTDVRRARPGDFLKIFWTEKIGSREFGHFVIFLGWRRDEAGQWLLCFWSSNVGAGYGAKSVPLSDCKRLLFTRITRPTAFAGFARLPETDEWLQNLLKREVSAAEMLRRCGLRAGKG